MNKLKILLLFIMFFSHYMVAQRITINYIESRLVTHQGIEFIGVLKDVNNDLYSFPDWNNESIIFIQDNRYYLSNLNFNVATNSFESRIKRDELFSYKTSEIDSVAINNHLFKKVGNSFYEVLFEKDNNLFLKKHDVKYKEGTVSRLNGSVGKATTSLKYKYLVKSQELVESFELNKKDFLNLFKDKNKKDIVEEFVKREHLSYKKEEDLIDIIQFMVNESGKII